MLMESFVTLKILSIKFITKWVSQGIIKKIIIVSLRKGHSRQIVPLRTAFNKKMCDLQELKWMVPTLSSS